MSSVQKILKKLGPRLSNNLTAISFYKKNGFDKDRKGNDNPIRLFLHLKGINFNFPVEKMKKKPGEIVQQYQTNDLAQGFYYSQCGCQAEHIGISPHYLDKNNNNIVNKNIVWYRVKQSVTVLKSTAASIIDNWSIPGKNVKCKGGEVQFLITKHHTLKRITI